MNLLQLVQDAAMESGISGAAGITDVTVLTGQQARVLGWVQKAWMQIQRMSDVWKFMRFTASFSTTNNQWLYSTGGNESLAPDKASPIVTLNTPLLINGGTPAVKELIDNSWRVYDNVAGVTSEVRMSTYDWEPFRDLFRFSSVQTQQQRPQFISLTPDRDIALALIPDIGQGSGYTVYGDFYAKPVPMAAGGGVTLNNVVPWFPEEFHELITWYAVLRYAGLSEASEQYTHAMNMAHPILTALRVSQLPKAAEAGPLA